MCAAAAIDYTYRYPFASGVGDFENGFGLRLATSDGPQASPWFFDGRLRHPKSVGDMLLTLSDVVRTHFFLPRPPMMDPVVTSGEGVLRFEGFSGCCGVYARVDLPAEAFDSDIHGRGTTNVDFNNPMRAALCRLNDRDDARLAVGADEVSLSRGDEKIIEKKVQLPIRWIKGFCEVQAYQPALSLRYELPVAEARRFIRSLPRGGAPKRPSFITSFGRALRLSQRETKGAIRITGLERIRIIEPLFATANSLQIWADDDAGVSGWRVIFETGSIFLLVSPEIYRGFSGEGQALEKLAIGAWADALTPVRAQLAWQSNIDASDIAARTSLSTDAISSALAVLGARGLAGYDAASGAYFHRELPFDLEQVEALQPRLRAARKLLDDRKVQLLTRDGNDADAQVTGTGVQHQVRLRGDDATCTCPWYSKYLGQRGPCKHILATRLLVAPDDEETAE
ncbi:MAG TPA: SWIM zinc finger family protein [Phycisphaerae bacterium]|nr:SWIM zinc finger family protein [Phycisphaerae bacterium]HRW51872.1 SWIM zinc finger family protein [Phycisphaerae bacterium]